MDTKFKSSLGDFSGRVRITLVANFLILRHYLLLRQSVTFYSFLEWYVWLIVLNEIKFKQQALHV